MFAYSVECGEAFIKMPSRVFDACYKGLAVLQLLPRLAP